MSPDLDTSGGTIGFARGGDVPTAPPGLLAGIRQHGLDDGGLPHFGVGRLDPLLRCTRPIIAAHAQ
jgi:hypothetical protein